MICVVSLCRPVAAISVFCRVYAFFFFGGCLVCFVLRSVEVSLEDAVELFIAADLYTLDRLKVRA